MPTMKSSQKQMHIFLRRADFCSSCASAACFLAFCSVKEGDGLGLKVGRAGRVAKKKHTKKTKKKAVRKEGRAKGKNEGMKEMMIP